MSRRKQALYNSGCVFSHSIDNQSHPSRCTFDGLKHPFCGISTPGLEHKPFQRNPCAVPSEFPPAADRWELPLPFGVCESSRVCHYS